MIRLVLPARALAVLAAACLLAFTAPVIAQTDPAASVLFSRGDVIARGSPAGQRALVRGDPVFSGDTVLVAADGRAQLRFSDGALVSLQASSEFRVDEYRYAGETDGNERGYFSLIKGGLRTVTGAIGRVNRSTYRVDAQVTTIGIRGTAYNALLCQGDCAEPDGTPTPDGLYVGVTDGLVSLANNAAEIVVGVGQNAFVPDIDTPPALVVPPPPTTPAATPTQDPAFQAGEQRQDGDLPRHEIVTPPPVLPPPEPPPYQPPPPAPHPP